MRRRQRRALENLNKHAEDIGDWRKARITKLGAKAAEAGLKSLTDVGFIWIPQDDEVPEGSLPTTFFTHEDEQEIFVKHELAFPIRNLGELATAVAAVDILYSRIENVVVYDRHGIPGLVEFLQESNGQKVSEG